MPEIEVLRSDVERILSRFQVAVRDGSSTSEHEVTLSATDWERLGGGYRSPEELVHASFEFLLAREPKESILASFDLSVIARYFPEFEREIARTD
jgi:hypothetical protein